MRAAYGGIGLLKGGGGLSAQYQRPKDFTRFEPLTIAGYPALNSATEGEANGCVITVGLTDDQAMTVEFDGTENKSTKFTCEAAKAMATDAVETIKSQQGN